MNPSVKLLGLLVVLLAGSAGWGLLATTALGRWCDSDLRGRVGPALRTAVGVALFLAFSGVLVALDAAHPWLLLGWHLVGAGALGADLVARIRRDGQPERRLVLFGASALVVGGLLVVAMIGNSLLRLPYNPYDDDGAYVYLAERLVRTGGLIDGFNQRRLVSYGGGTVYHAVFLRFLGNGTLFAFDQVFGVVLVAMLAVWRRGRRGVLAVGAVLAIGIAFGRGVGLITNVTPVLLAVALTLAALQLVELAIDAALPERRRVFFPLIGLVLAALLSLRFTFVIPVGIAIAVAMLVDTRRVRSALALAPIGLWTLLFSGGWAIALQRSSGTPLFPLIAGNYDTSWPGGTDPNINTVGEYASRIFDVMRSGDLGLIVLAMLVVALVLAVRRRRRSAQLSTLVGAGVGCLAQIVVITYAFSGAALYNLQRFVAPTVLAAGLYALDLLWRPAVVRADAPSTEVGAGNPGWLGRLGTQRVGAIAALGSGIVLVLMLFGGAPWDYVAVVRDRLDAGVSALTHRNVFEDRYAGSRTEYLRLEHAIPAHAKVLVATNLPQLLDPGHVDLATLDIAGSVSPPPHLPFFRGVEAKVRYLRAQGFDYLVAQDPEVGLGLFSRQGWQANLDGPVGGVRGVSDVRWSPYMIDWMDDVEQLAAHDRRHVREFGPLILIPLHQTPRARTSGA